VNPDEYERIKARLKASADLTRRKRNPSEGTARPRPHAPGTEREELLDAGFAFSVQERDRAEAEVEHRARRRRAEEATRQRERLYRTLRDRLGSEEADKWIRGIE
jgi:hypothetical protein